MTDLLPIGPHEMVLTCTWPNAPALTVATGYLDLPESYDLERDCAFEVTATETFNDVEPSTTNEFAKAPGSNSWNRVTANDREDYEVGTWVDGSWRTVRTYLPPAGTTGRGDAFWCELRRTGQAARIADPENGVLEWDAAGLLEAQNAGKAA